MIDIKPTAGQRIHAKLLSKIGHIANKVEFTGDTNQQFIGKLGEVIFADCAKYSRPPVTNGPDSGTDFIIEGCRIDVKTVLRKVPMKSHYAHNFLARQTKYNTDCYVFCSYNQADNIMTLCGYLLKDEFLRVAKFIKKGENIPRDDGTKRPAPLDMYEVLNKQLRPIEEILSVIQGGTPCSNLTWETS